MSNNEICSLCRIPSEVVTDTLLNYKLTGAVVVLPVCNDCYNGLRTPIGLGPDDRRLTDRFADLRRCFGLWSEHPNFAIGAGDDRDTVRSMPSSERLGESTKNADGK